MLFEYTQLGLFPFSFLVEFFLEHFCGFYRNYDADFLGLIYVTRDPVIVSPQQKSIMVI